MRFWRYLWLCVLAGSLISGARAGGKGDAFFAQGLRDFNQGQSLQAIASFGEAARLDPDNDLYRVHLGITYASLRRYDEAIREFRQAISINPDKVLAYFLLEGAYLEKGMRPEADEAHRQAKRLFSKVDGIVFHSDRDIEDLKRLLERFPQDAIVENLLGDAYQLQERIEEAMAHYRRAVALAPRWVKPHFNLGMACLGRDPNRAIEEFQTVLRLDPGNLKANLWLGNAYTYSNMYDKALTTYNQVRQQAPDMPGVAQQMGQAYLQKRQYPEAERELQKATRQAPRDPVPRVLLGQTYAARKKFPEAVQEYQAALQQADVESSRTVLVMSYLGLASAYEAMQQPKMALKTLERAASLDRVHAATYLREAGQIAERQGNQMQAIAYWRGSLEADPEADGWTTAQLLQSRGLLPDIIADYERSLHRQPNSLPLLTALSGLYRFQRNYRGALPLAQRIVALMPNSISGWVTLGQIYEGMGNLSQAANAYRRALAIQPKLPRLRQLLERVEDQR